MQQLDTHQVHLVRLSFGEILPVRTRVAGAFYQRLFAIKPEASALFDRVDKLSQGEQFLQMVTFAVINLNNIRAFAPQMKKLGARHAKYGVRDDHYASAGEALLWALEQELGEHFTSEVKQAWEITYKILAETAIAGANDAPFQNETD